MAPDESDAPPLHPDRGPYLIASRRTVRAWTLVGGLLGLAALVAVVALGFASRNADHRLRLNRILLEKNTQLIDELQHQAAVDAAKAYQQEACHQRVTSANVRANGEMLSTLTDMILLFEGHPPKTPAALLAEVRAAQKTLDEANIAAGIPHLCGPSD